MIKRVKLVHGFNVFDGGESTIDKLVRPLERKGYEVDSTGEDYGWTGLLLVLLFNSKRASHLKENYKTGTEEFPEEVIIGHSNGCAIIARAIDAGMPVKHVIFVHPALDNDWEPPKNSTVERIDVYYSEKDAPTKWAARIPGVLWGDMGTVGPTSTSEVFVKHNDGLRHSEGFTLCPDRYIETL